MAPTRAFALWTAAGLVLLTGCSGTQQLAKKSPAFFKPVVTRTSVPGATASRADMDTLRMQLQRLEQRLTATELVRSYAPDTAQLAQIAELRQTNMMLASRVTELELRLTAVASLQSRPAPNDTLLRHNSVLLGLVGEMREKITKLEAGNRPTTTIPEHRKTQLAPTSSPQDMATPAGSSVPSMQEEYGAALGAFHERSFEEAASMFRGLIDRGIQEDLADNCEYWVGESEFAMGDYRRAVEAFLRVISMTASNKRPDAYLMLGRSYESMNDLAKAQSAYETLVRQHPDSPSASIARGKLSNPRFIGRSSEKRNQQRT